MSFHTTQHRHPDYLELILSGEATLKHFVELVTLIESETVYWSDRRVLVDMRAITGGLPPAEQMFLGELVAQNLSHLDRVASVVRPEQITRNSETAARRRGFQLLVFASRQEAAAWLVSELVTTPG